MAIYHLSVTAISRKSGRSATAAAAYRAGEKIVDERTNQQHDYRRKQGVISADLALPDHAPEWAKNRATLWNAAEQIERRKDACVAREVRVALPAELDEKERWKLAYGFAKEMANAEGCAVDVCIHKPDTHGDDRNYHAHLLRTTRKVDAEGLGTKLDTEKAGRKRKDDLTQMRERWASLCNVALSRNNIAQVVDHRTLEAQGIDRLPQIHLGAKVIEMERRGIRTERGKRALDIDKHNAQIIDFQNAKERLSRELHRETQSRPELGRTRRRDSTARRSARDTGRDGEKNPDRASSTDRNASPELGGETKRSRPELEPNRQRDSRNSQSDKQRRKQGRAQQRIVFLADMVERHGDGRLDSERSSRGGVAMAGSLRTDARGDQLPDLQTQLAQIQKRLAEERAEAQREAEREAKRLRQQEEQARQERLEQERARRAAKREQDRDRGFER